MNAEHIFKKEQGAVHNMLLCLLGLMSVIVISLVFVKTIEANNLNTEARHALDLSAKYLYADIPDFDEFTKTGSISISDQNIIKMHKVFKEMTAYNMNLEYEDNMFYEINNVIGTAKPTNVIVSGDVTLTDFIVYVLPTDDTIKQIKWTGAGSSTVTKDYGTVYAPDGMLVTQPCIYAKIKMNLSGYFGAAASAEKEIICMLLRNNSTDKPTAKGA